MKKLILTFCALTLLFSCSDDDGGGTEDRSDFLPTNAGSSWSYDYTVANQGTSNSGSTTVSYSSASIDGQTYQMLDNTIYLIGAMNTVPFQKNANNEIDIRPRVDFLDNTWDFGNMNFIKNVMSNNQILATSTQEFVGQSIDIPDENITGTVTPHTYITINAQHIGKSNSMMVNNVNYENILQNKLMFDIRIVLQINATYQGVEFDREHELVPQQTYGNLDLWFAENTGIIQSEYSYSLRDVQMNTEVNVVGSLNINLLNLAPELANFNNSINLEGTAMLTSFQ